MDIWFEETIVSEKEKVYKYKGLTYKALVFVTDKGSKGIRVPLMDNGELFSKFHTWIKSLLPNKKSLSTSAMKKAKKYNLIPFVVICDNEKGTENLWPIMGFYVLNDFLVFSDEGKYFGSWNSPKGKIRLNKFIKYYGKKYKLV